jgi:anti-sigma B factor antagonist
VTVDDDRAVVALNGEHEAYTAGKLAQEFNALLDQGVRITVDLRRCTFIDSTVVGLLLATSRSAAGRGVAFVLHLDDETGWPVERLLEVTGLGTEFDIVRD